MRGATVCAACGSFPCRCARPVDNRRPIYRPLRETCRCRGPEIVAPTRLAGDIVDAVQRHQIEPAHIAYDEAHGIPLSQEQLRVKALDGIARELVGAP